MSLLVAKDLALFRGTPLFTGLDFAVAKGDRIGLVAANGRGKSSLLRILAGQQDATGGDVTAVRGLIAALAPQDPPARLLPMSMRHAVADALGADLAEAEGWRVDLLLDDLGVDAAVRSRAVADLSGGWQRTMLLARAAVVAPDLLLLDEPTNHLDLGRIGVLQRFLAALPRDCAVIAASHDRAFLDETTSRTLFLRPEDSAGFALPYTPAAQALAQRDAAQDRRHDNDMRKVRALRQQAAKLKNIGINSGSDLLVTKTKQLSERAERLEAQARPAHRERSAGLIRLTGSASHAKALIAVGDATIVAPDGRTLFQTGKLWIENGDRIALLGANGTGKTMLVERLRAALGGSDPQIRCAASVRAGCSDQALSQLDGFATPWDAVKHAGTLDDREARAQLAGAGISIDAQTARLAQLSGGQRARLAMMLLRLAQPNLYLLDEPTNHLDIEGQRMLEGELTARETACLLVSHDRAFVRAVGTRFWVIDRRRLVEVDDPEPVFARLTAA